MSTTWTSGDISGSQTLSTADHLFNSHVNEMRTAINDIEAKTDVTSTADLTKLANVTATATELNILDGVTASTSELNIMDGVTSSTSELNILDGATLSTTELNYVDGVTSAIQTQLDAKAGSSSLSAHISDTTTHGTTGDVVGTSDTQELSNKTHDGDFNLKNSTDNIIVASGDPWRTISLNPGFLKPTTTSGCADAATVEAGTNDVDYDVLDFDNTSDEFAFAGFQMPDSWDGGTIQFRYIWTTASGSSSETVQMGLKGRAFANDDAIDQTHGTEVTLSDTWIADGDIHISSWSSNVTLEGTPTGGQWVQIKIRRDTSNDDLGGDVRIIGLQIRYKVAQFSD